MTDNGAIAVLGVVGAMALGAELNRRRNPEAWRRQIPLYRQREDASGVRRWTQTVTVQRKAGGKWKQRGSRAIPGPYARSGSLNDAEYPKLLRLLGYSSSQIKQMVKKREREKRVAPLGFQWPKRGSSNKTYRMTDTKTPPRAKERTLIIHRRKGKVVEWFLQQPNGTGGGVDTTASPSIPAVLKRAQKYWQALAKTQKIPSTLRVMVIDNVSSDTWKDFHINTQTLSEVRR